MKLPTQRKKQKKRKTDSPFETGMSLIQGNLHKQATKVLSEALKKDSAGLTSKVLKAFDEQYNAQHYENAIAIGEALSDTQVNDSSFFVKMGNSYRRQIEPQKANNSYRQALKVNRSDQLATYNLAASFAKVEKYDLEIVKSMDLISSLKPPVLPSFLNDPDILEKISLTLEKDREQLRLKIESLIEEKETQSEVSNVQSVKELIHAIEVEERKLSTSTYEATCKKLRQAFKKNWARQTINETKTVLQENQFNLTLYAFSQKDVDLVTESLNKLNAEDNKLENLDLLTALSLDLKGSPQDAIKALTPLLKQRIDDRYLNVNLGLLYKKTGNQLQSLRFLIKAVDLLEKSEGLYGLHQIESRADEYHHNGDLVKALNLYQLITEEKPTAGVLIRLGEIQIKQDQLVEATISFNEAKELDPRNKVVDQKLMDIHNLYYQKADTHSRNGLYPEAITLYQNALEIHKSVEVISRLIKIYERLNDFSQIVSLKNEIEKLENSKQEKEQGNRRQILVDKGKELMKKKQFNGAIELLEKAFEMKPDKDVFLLLAHIFKGLNQTRRLSSLLRQWRVAKDREDKNRELNG
jgi:tetratricopeptide (TPR) repeat protein